MKKYLLLILLVITSSCSSDERGNDDGTNSVNCNSAITIVVLDVTTNSVSLAWNNIENVTSYELEYGEVGFEQGNGTFVTTANNNLVINNLQGVNEYEVYIKAVCGSSEEAWLGPFNFSLECDSEIIVTNPSVTSSSLSLSWNTVVNASSYELEYGELGFSQGTGTLITASGNTVLNGLNHLQGYDVYVRAICASQNVIWHGPFSFYTICDSSGGTYNGNVNLYDQAALDTFSLNCYEVINGNLSVLGITDYYKLNSLKEVTGNFYISDCDSGDFQGLDNLQTIGGKFEIDTCTNLISLSGLESLQYVGQLFIDETSIENFQGLNNLQTINGEFYLSENHYLVNFEGLNNLERIESVFSIESCSNQNFIGLDSLTYVNSLYLVTYGLRNFEGFSSSINTINGDFTLFHCTGLDNFLGLENVTTITGVFDVANSNQENFSGLENLNTVHVLSVDICNNISNFEGLNNLSTINNILYVYGNSSLVSLVGLENLDNVTNILINENDSLINYCALDNLIDNGTFTSFSTDLNQYNPDLSDMNNGNCSQ